MPPRGSEARLAERLPSPAHPVTDLVLARICCEGGATRAEIVRDVGALCAHRLSPGEWRALADAACAWLVATGLATEQRSRLGATEVGAAEAARQLRLDGKSALSWLEVRDVVLVARALGAEGESLGRLRALADPDALRTHILQRAFGLKGKRNVPAAKLRAQLAIVALERAFGNKIKAGIGKGERLPSKAARALAAQLSKSPREFATDQKLVAALAAEVVGAAQPEPDALRAAILKRHVTGLFEKAGPLDSPPAEIAQRSEQISPTPVERKNLPAAANDREPKAAGQPPPRPGLADFSDAVLKAAAARAQGWPSRAFICHVWDAIRTDYADWSLSEIEFKAMLAEAHRQGTVKLATADLKSKSAEFQRSETPFGANTMMHYVRVEV
ncbi:MAG: hypothetical protein NW216_01400 [Hyphomicrobium sp.]|nr:hypothetical protein [Hyphomicrobium sp.]